MAIQKEKNYQIRLKEIHDPEVLMNEVKTYIKDEKALADIQRAYDFAKEKHGEQKRANGDPYIYHPLTTAYFLAQYKMGPTTIIAGLLHDVIEDTPIKPGEITEAFGEEVNMLVEAVTKVSYFAKDNRQQLKATYLRRLYLSMAQDIRVMIIKICDRLHNMLTIGNLPEYKQKIIAKETLDTYSTIAHRIGMNGAKSALEELSFQVLEPKEAKKIGKLLEEQRKERIVEVNQIITDLNEFLNDEKHIEIKAIFGREKSIYSVYRKMMYGKTFDEINDILAIRIIAKNVDDCYKILGFIHQKYIPIPGRFKDYIATPKNNLYQSLHTTVSNKNGMIFEVQIRTEEMDEYAEMGAAAHWRYKENDNSSAAQKQQEIDDKLDIFKRIISMNNDETDAANLEKDLQEDIFTSTIYVLTPNGNVLTLPYGSTVLDFAYRIHSEVGEKAIGARINGVFSPLNTVIHSGEVIEVKTSPTQTPNLNWLKIAKTSSARNKIRKWLAANMNSDSETQNKKDKEEATLVKGKGQVISYINSENIRNKRRSEKETLELLKKDGYQSLEDIYLEIANGKIKVEDAVEKYFVDLTVDKDDALLDQINKGDEWAPDINNDLIVDGISNMKVEIANCCLPIPYEEVVGYVTKGNGIKVHLPNCTNVQSEEDKKRLVSVRWNKNYIQNKNYVTKVRFVSNDRPNLLYDITKVLSSLHAAIISASANTNEKTFTSTGVVKLKVHNSDQLRQIITAMKSIPGVLEVDRVIEEPNNK
ncbi:RelA/SpoT family protein [Mesoplasma lactucae]|uniref:Penta-phosphate guanosine-3'-pyrophosphohydrolase n=1 Tax=Mesoplasma lactucae ATCC 49193 TaxID=81460 RepID=A0A291IR70_9MOLU|nr:RelA/SpoT family protein [Mesoplasma lactucae]ATG97362.1 guanosine-3',5'-bis(diphosphate) 3'-pyrophosphohydrolase [Mesoplasma lactucae ATCC 49193]ATZ20186.1 GTP diphosphokinase [Mesoplasma lactucae ATCC 49193]MCL8216935.1 GTP pyrophosphokinase [Mesoplasma lactucae ATCC 49193]